MDKDKVVHVLYAKDTKETYADFRALEALCDASDEIYPFFEECLCALKSEKSCVRGRGFKLICRCARWDKDNKTQTHLAEILAVLDDEKPTVVRQCLTVLPLLCTHKPALQETVVKKLDALDVAKYKESMQGLIQKDIENVKNAFALH